MAPNSNGVLYGPCVKGDDLNCIFLCWVIQKKVQFYVSPGGFHEKKVENPISLRYDVASALVQPHVSQPLIDKTVFL